jgi:hypothetical protein
MSYASGTSVSEERSRIEIEKLLRHFGADGFLYATEGRKARIAFKHGGLAIKFTINLPEDAELQVTERGRIRRGGVLQKAVEQETRRRWRSLGLAIKAKLVAVADGVETFEAAFMPYIMWGRSGKTIGEQMLPRVREMAQLPASEIPLLTAGPGSDPDLQEAQS